MDQEERIILLQALKRSKDRKTLIEAIIKIESLPLLKIQLKKLFKR